MESPLEKQHCKACEGDVEPMNQEQIKNLITQVPDWEVNEEGTVISRTFKFKNFFRTMSFVNAVAHVANQEGHHPDFQVGYSHCAILFTTHAINGLSHNDFICARKIDLLF
jgi:4a-hydroxytetrahydrobiopterin dehydratase